MARPREKRKHPLVGKGKTFPFQTSVACWIDLLGYGGMIAKADFNPLHPGSKEALKRLRRFHEIIASHSGRYFRTLVVNDGAVAYRDLSYRIRSVTHDFLVRAWSLYNDIKRSETEASFPGARLVLACGFRMHNRRTGRDATNPQFRSIMRRFRNREIEAERAINEAASIRESFDIAPHLQANFAFTKAYVAESSGTAGGLGGANFYIDLDLLETPTPDWIRLGPTISWKDERLRMQASFAQVIDIPPWRHVEGGPIGIRDGLQVAQQLARDPNVLHALRSARQR